MSILKRTFVIFWEIFGILFQDFNKKQKQIEDIPSKYTHIGVVGKDGVGWSETLFCMHGCDGPGRHKFKLAFHNSSDSHPLFTFRKSK